MLAHIIQLLKQFGEGYYARMYSGKVGWRYTL